MKKELIKVFLNQKEQVELNALVSKGRPAVRQVKRARVRLALHQGEKLTPVASLAGVSRATGYNIYHRYLTAGLKTALVENLLVANRAK